MIRIVFSFSAVEESFGGDLVGMHSRLCGTSTCVLSPRGIALADVVWGDQSEVSWLQLATMAPVEGKWRYHLLDDPRRLKAICVGEGDVKGNRACPLKFLCHLNYFPTQYFKWFPSVSPCIDRVGHMGLAAFRFT